MYICIIKSTKSVFNKVSGPNGNLETFESELVGKNRWGIIDFSLGVSSHQIGTWNFSAPCPAGQNKFLVVRQAFQRQLKLNISDYCNPPPHKYCILSLVNNINNYVDSGTVETT